jgi:hypothetical protein
MDDKVMWKGGRFLPLERPEFVSVAKRYENGERAFADNLQIGI